MKREPKIGECPYCGDNFTFDHRCPEYITKKVVQTVNKLLREQVAEAIVQELCGQYADWVLGDEGGLPSYLKAADAAIQAVKEGMRCGRCKMWGESQYVPAMHLHTGYCRYRVETWMEDDGCIHWEAKGE